MALLQWRESKLPSPPEPGPALMPRRGFLEFLSGVCAAIAAVFIGLPAVRAFFSPALPKPKVDSWVRVADDVALLDVGVPIRLDFVQTVEDAWVESRTLNSVWLYTEDGERFKAYNGHCTHLGCSYVFNQERKNFFCPCHGGEFDVKTGEVIAGPPPRALDDLKVEIRDSAVYVDYRDFRLGVPERVEA